MQIDDKLIRKVKVWFSIFWLHDHDFERATVCTNTDAIAGQFFVSLIFSSKIDLVLFQMQITLTSINCE